MKILKLALFCSLVLTMTGCASIAGNNTRAVKVTSTPAGAGIYVDNQKYGTTPAIINLPNYIYGGKSVTLKKPGYQDQSVMVNSKFQAVALWNILFWPGWVIDAATGNIVKIDPNNLNLHSRLAKA